MSKKVTSKYKSISFILFFILIVAVILGTYQFSLAEKYKTEDTVPLSDYQDLNQKLSEASELLEIDKTWIQTMDVESTLKKYKEFKSNNPELFTDWVNSRLNRLKDLRDSSQDDELNKMNLRTQLRETNQNLSELVKTSDSLKLEVTKNSQRSAKKEDSLMKIIYLQKSQLKRKEDVKVISFRNEKGNLIHYIGETQNDMANGNGIGIWNTGSIYRGEWTNNIRNGEGEFVWEDGAKYNGDFKMGERSGEGTFNYPSGEKYVGEFKKGLRDGYGVLYDRDGNLSYEGNWANDKPEQ